MRLLATPLALLMLAPAYVQAAPPPGQITLLQTLRDWAYPGTMEPGTKLPVGPEMSDGGYPGVQSVKCKAVLATPDPVEKVVAFYERKLKVDGPADPKAAQSVAIQDDSAGRPLAVRVIAVNRADTSTTLVISRAEGEKETHIAWTHYIRIGGR